MYFEDYDPDDEWFYNSIQKYDDLLIYEFQGRVSSACFLTEERLVATCLNLNSGNEILELALPDRLLATKDAGLLRNRDFHVVSAGYSQSSASKIISRGKVLVTSEDEGINIYQIPDSKLSDLITHELKLRGTPHPRICICHQEETIFSGSHCGDIESHSLTNGKKKSISTPNCVYSQKSPHLSVIDNRANNLIIGLRDIGLILNIDLRSNAYRTIRPNTNNDSKWWTCATSLNGDLAALVSSAGEIFIFDSRNPSKEILKFESEFSACEKTGKHLVLQFDPKETFISVSGFDKTVKVFSLKASSENHLPIFVHDGHAKSVDYICGHVWHPTLPSVIFSYDEKGILHAWKFS